MTRISADAFDIAGVRVVLDAEDPALRRLARAQRPALGVPVKTSSGAHVVIRAGDGARPPLPRLKTQHNFNNGRFLYLSDGKRCLITGHFYERPWQIDIRPLPRW